MPSAAISAGMARLSQTNIDAFVLKAFGEAPVPADRLSVPIARAELEQKIVALFAAGPLDEAMDPLQVHQRIVQGLPGSAMFSAPSLVYDTIDEISEFFETTPKTFRARIKLDRLRTDESERVVRIGRVTMAAAQALGSFEAGRQYLRTKNYALGGATPLELIHTADGERLVLDELQAHAEGGPL